MSLCTRKLELIYLTTTEIPTDVIYVVAKSLLSIGRLGLGYAIQVLLDDAICIASPIGTFRFDIVVTQVKILSRI